MFSNLNALMWLFITIGLIVTEIATYQLVAVWFALGGAAAMVTAFAGWLEFKGQLTVFLVVSVLALAAFRPFVKKVLRIKPVATNVDQLVGQTATVIQPIDPMRKGRVHVGGLDWSASACEPIEEGKTVEVLSIEGATLLVREK